MRSTLSRQTKESRIQSNALDLSNGGQLKIGVYWTKDDVDKEKDLFTQDADVCIGLQILKVFLSIWDSRA